MTDIAAPLNESEIDELESFLLYDDTPEECMNLSMLDGFLTGLAIGPDTILPSRWLPAVWGETKGDEMAWKSPENAERIMGLVMRLYNSIIRGFQVDPPDFRPLMPVSEADGEEFTILDEWCSGFMCSLGLAPESWDPLVADEEQGVALFPITLHGTEGGWEALKNDPKIAKVPHEEWVALIFKAVREIHDFWLPVRQAEAQVSQAAMSEKIGRNVLCPCGSGKKYKKCCGSAEA
ncbi:UPF0149 family protein [Candidatus Neomarinimicrobiota bacterium]